MNIDKEIDQLVDIIGEEVEQLAAREPHGSMSRSDTSYHREGSASGRFSHC